MQMSEMVDLANVDVDERLAKRLGYAAILTVGKSLRLGSVKGGDNRSVLLSTDKDAARAVRSGGIGLIFDNYAIDGKLIAELEANDSIMYISMRQIVSNYGFGRSRSISMARKLLSYAMRKRVRVGFISFADSVDCLCSKVQMIELAKLIGAGESYARTALSQTNSELLRALTEI